MPTTAFSSVLRHANIQKCAVSPGGYSHTLPTITGYRKLWITALSSALIVADCEEAFI